MRNALVALVAATALASAAQAAVISFDFTGASGGNPAGMQSTDKAGVQWEANWNNVALVGNWSHASTTLNSVYDSTGTTVAGMSATTSVDLADWSAESTGTNDAAMFSSYGRAGGPMSVAVTGMPTGAYDVYVYIQGGPEQYGWQWTYGSVNGTAFGSTSGGPRVGSASTFTDGSGYVLATSSSGGNYIKFSNLTGNLTMTLDGTGDWGDRRLKYAGFQIVSAPEPASLGLLGISALFLIRRRRA